ncbi:glycosyltransferase family 9 protein [Runella sp.]|jgi:heptosyltransferase III|uniref:glycosyltransferase family 9 protein n=1 Tax=Runella sp. TaxID=1960881 RepID=UPI00301B3A01
MKRKYSGTPRETIPLKVIDSLVDIYAKWFYKKRRRNLISDTPKVLIASLGHMGDALTVSYLFPIIYKKYPNAVIDIISPTWCKAVNDSNPYIRHVFYIDHFLSNRSKINTWQKLKQNYRTFREVLSDLKKDEYDYYLDVRTSYAVSHFILPFIHVKKAIGFNRRGLGGLLDVELDISKQATFHHFDTYSVLLKEMGIEVKLEEVVPYFTINPSISQQQIEQKLPSKLSSPYVLLFPETGEEHRQMSSEFWATIVGNVLNNSNYSFVLCGQTDLSARIIKNIQEVTDSRFVGRVLDGSKRLSIQELAFLATGAEYALTLDSFPEHLCCIFCKTITIYKASGLPFYPIANFPVLLLHGHTLSLGVEFVRKNVEILYRENMETEEVKNLIAEKIIS